MADLEALARFGERASSGAPLATVLDEALALLAGRLGATHALLVEPLKGSDLFVVRADRGWVPSIAGELVADAGPSPYFRRVLEGSVPVLTAAARPLEVAAVLHDQGLAAGLSLPLTSAGEPLAVLGAYAPRLDVTAEALVFARALGHALAAAIGRHAAEQTLARSEKRLQTVLRMEAIGRLAGGVAHDFNNLVQAISGYSEMVLHQMAPDHPLRGHLDEIKRAGDRAAGLTRQLLAFSRQQVLQPRVLALDGVVRGIEPLLRRLVGEDVGLRTRLAPGLWAVRADAAQLEQVLMNLAVNARDAMPAGGLLTIETSNVTLPSREQPDAFIQPGPYVRLSVEDTGVGMDEETKFRAFEPFFTTKAPGHGTGLGLSTVYGIVKQSGGYILVDSAPGSGTRMRVYLPRVDERPEEAPVPAAPPAGVAGRAETVLLVEDEEGVRDLVREWLETHGYRVLAAGSAAEALRLAPRYDGPIHVLLADVVMPGMGGPELASRLERERPGMKVIFVSGYADDSLSDPRLAAGAAFVQKPFSLDHLVRTVRRVLDAPGGGRSHGTLGGSDE